METPSSTPRPFSVHSRPTRALAVVAWAICAFLSVNLVLAGTAAEMWQFLPWMLFIAWGLYVLLWRPQLLVRAGGLSVRNLLRDHDIPFSQLKAVRVVQSVSFDTTAGRIASWGAPGASKLGRKLPSAPGIPDIASEPATKTAVQAAWDAWERNQPSPGMPDAGTSSAGAPLSQPGHPEKVETRWNVPTAVVGAIAVLLVVASLLS